MTEVSNHLQVETSDRGFGRLPAIPGAYGGQVRTYESSAASGPHLWLQIKIPAGAMATQSEAEEATLHLTADNAVKLAEQLQFLVAHHYQAARDE